MIPAWVARDLEGLSEAGLRRTTLAVEGPTGPSVRAGGETLVNFSSNDYLGLAAHPSLAAAAGRAAEQWGSGAGASRLICGTLALHEELERELARFKGTEAALLFSTGYQANLSLLQALMPEGVILSDELNHASIVDGCRLARAEVRVYRHRDVDHLAELLQGAKGAPRTLIVTDGVFSMDGDLAPLADLADLAERHGALLVVDDAHATGTVGGGRGTAYHFGVEGRVDVVMGTLGKALGSFGAFAACTRPVRDLLLNRARSLIYTTAPAPPSVGAALEALRIVTEEPERVGALSRNAALLRSVLREEGFSVESGVSPIVPLVLADNTRTLAWAAALRREGFWAHAIRPPTVPDGTARLRLTACATHTSEQLRALGTALGRLCAAEAGGRQGRAV